MPFERPSVILYDRWYNQGPESRTILVVGGGLAGIAGITKVVEAAECGYDVVLLEEIDVPRYEPA